MLKKLYGFRYLFTVGIIFGFAVYVSHQYQRTREQCAKECEHINPKTITPAAPAKDCDKCEQDAERHFPSWYRIFVWPQGIETLAILLTLLAIADQTNQTRRSADAAAESANAAYGSVNFAEAQWRLMIDEKRARLDLKVESTDLGVEVAGEDLVHLIATISVKNIGASKAFIKRTSGTLITRLHNESLGDSDGYSPLDIPEKAIAPDRDPIPIRVYCFPTSTARTFAECLEEGTFTLYFFGFIEYETLGFGQRIEFEYEWRIVGRNDSLGGMLGLSDPYPNSSRPAKDRIAYGYWQANKESSGEEHPITDQTDTQNPN